jgi:ribosomal protein S18 acetylase RimI-like enzyme
LRSLPPEGALSGFGRPLATEMFDPSAIDGALRHVRDPLLARVEEAGLNAAQPREQLLLDGWLLRFSPGKARRARSVQALAAGTLPLADKLALCRRWYERFRLPLLVRVTPFSQPASLDERLAEAGFVGYDETRVMTSSLVGSKLVDDGPMMRDVDAATFAQAVGRLRGSPPAQIDAHLSRLLDSPLSASSVRLVGLDADGVPRVAGQIAVQDDLAGLYDIVTDPAMRGRGLAGALSRRLLHAAAAMGALTAYLQVDAGNAPARRIYARLGFADRYAYWYRRPADVVDDIQQEARST